MTAAADAAASNSPEPEKRFEEEPTLELVSRIAPRHPLFGVAARRCRGRDEQVEHQL